MSADSSFFQCPMNRGGKKSPVLYEAGRNCLTEPMSFVTVHTTFVTDANFRRNVGHFSQDLSSDF